MVRAEGAKTHISLLFIDENGERNPVMIRPTTARALTMDDIDRDAVAAADVLHIGGADQLGDFLGEPLAELIHFAREHDTVVTVDVLGAGTDEMRERLAPALSEAQFFFPNEGQVAGMTGTEDPGEGAARLRELLGVETVVGTLGAEGSLIVGADGATPVPAFEIDLVDTTGCGDAYVAGFIVAVANGWDGEAAGLARCRGLGLGRDRPRLRLRHRRPPVDARVHGLPSAGADRRPRPRLTRCMNLGAYSPQDPCSARARPSG
jgi:sugar/nucleoside kinase (ribokinase family)